MKKKVIGFILLALGLIGGGFLIYFGTRSISIGSLKTGSASWGFKAIKGFKSQYFEVFKNDPVKIIPFGDYEIWTGVSPSGLFGITIYPASGDAAVKSYVMNNAGSVTEYQGAIPS